MKLTDKQLARLAECTEASELMVRYMYHEGLLDTQACLKRIIRADYRNLKISGKETREEKLQLLANRYSISASKVRRIIYCPPILGPLTK